MKVREVIRDLEALGWQIRRRRGSHRVLRHPDYGDRRVVVAGNEGTDVPVGTLAAITAKPGSKPPGQR